MTDDLHEEYDDDDDAEELEAYCMSCRESHPIEDAEAVWTRKGQPATRGVCMVCGTTVFRMGRTPAHARLKAPRPVNVTGVSIKKGPMAELATFVAYAPEDASIASQLAQDLKNGGYPTWLNETESEVEVAWASGVHPALNECTRMVVVLSPAALTSERVSEAWGYFRDQRKRIFIAQVQPAEIPDELRRSPRFDFDEDYKSALRQLVQALM